jgi:Fur family ferric uptake transcriptional regulator
MESRIERMCVALGLKMTGQRRVIARVLSEATDHPDVEELYRRASAIDPKVSIATVYRTVRLLEEKGILEKRDFGEGRARYDPTDRGHHHHLIDVDTGKVIEFADEGFERMAREIAERLGFALASSRLQLFGRRLAVAEPPVRTGSAARRPADPDRRPAPRPRARHTAQRRTGPA